MNLLTTFILANLVNVIVQTIKSIMTIKCGKTAAALINAFAYGFYTWIVILMVCDLPVLQKALIIGGCNLIGVYAVKLLEEKSRKDKLWKIEVTLPTDKTFEIDRAFEGMPHNYIKIDDKYTLFNFYCATQKQSKNVKNLIDNWGAKYFVTESKIL